MCEQKDPKRRWCQGPGALSTENKAPGVMAAGHVFTVEPMINAGRYEDTICPATGAVDGRRKCPSRRGGGRVSSFHCVVAPLGRLNYLNIRGSVNAKVF